jgi:hypothetical protein
VQNEYDMKALLSEVILGPNKVVSVSNPEKFKALFYRVRRALIQEGINGAIGLSCRTSPDNPQGEVWLVKESSIGT